MSRFWPVGEPGQAAYERLRSAALANTLVLDRDAVLFTRRGLPALIIGPVAEPLFVAQLTGSPRPPWSPYADPRLDTLAEAYQLLIAGTSATTAQEVAE